jgi:hypothetical protein
LRMSNRAGQPGSSAAGEVVSIDFCSSLLSFLSFHQLTLIQFPPSSKHTLDDLKRYLFKAYAGELAANPNRMDLAYSNELVTKLYNDRGLTPAMQLTQEDVAVIEATFAQVAKGEVQPITLEGGGEKWEEAGSKKHKAAPAPNPARDKDSRGPRPA